MKDFIIPFKGLRLGDHTYDWDLDKKFFEEAENPEILACNLHVELLLEKKERMLELNFRIAGTLTVPCDRCLAPLDLPVNIDESYYIKIGLERMEESEEVIIIPETDYQIDLAPLIFDYVSLAVPIKKVHDEDSKGNSKCDQEMLRKLENMNKTETVDPRWDALKNIKIENDN